MNKSGKVKWAMLIMLLLLDILITVALVYSVVQSRVMISGNDPFILNVAMVFAIIDVALWVLTFLMMYEVRTDSTLNQRIVTIERILMEKGVSIRK
jgi:uncharacterized membrane protein